MDHGADCPVWEPTEAGSMYAGSLRPFQQVYSPSPCPQAVYLPEGIWTRRRPLRTQGDLGGCGQGHRNKSEQGLTGSWRAEGPPCAQGLNASSPRLSHWLARLPGLGQVTWFHYTKNGGVAPLGSCEAHSVSPVSGSYFSCYLSWLHSCEHPSVGLIGSWTHR